MENNEILDQAEKPVKYHSSRAIGLSTFLGGPLAGGYLLRQNFISQGENKRGSYAMASGIFITLIVFAGLFLIPQHVVDKIPNVLIPAILSGIALLIVNKYQGETLKIHKENNKLFHSGWNAAAVSLVSMLITIAGAALYVFTATTPANAIKYDIKLAEYTANEEKALGVFPLLEKGENKRALTFIRDAGIPAWQDNINLLDEMDKIEGLDESFTEQNRILREYCLLRIESYELFEKAITEESSNYDNKIEEINNEINLLINKLG